MNEVELLKAEKNVLDIKNDPGEILSLTRLYRRNY